jgi:hypothetical protein
MVAVLAPGLDEPDERVAPWYPKQFHDERRDRHLRRALQRENDRGIGRKAERHERIVEFDTIRADPHLQFMWHPRRHDWERRRAGCHL